MTSEREDDECIKMTSDYQQITCKLGNQNKIEDEELVSRKGIFHQVISTCAVLLLSAACGLPIGYSAVLLPQLTVTNVITDEANNETTIATIPTTTTTTTTSSSMIPEIAIDIEMGSWIASVHSLATPIGSLISGPFADFIGRRRTLLTSVIPTILGWCVIGMAQSYPMLIAGRLLCGFATGLLGGPAQVYIAETAEPNLRGLLIGAPFVSYSLGILIVYALGSSLHWRTVAWCGNLLPIIAFIAICCIPESPVWLLRNNRAQEALRSLNFLRGNEIAAQKELNEMSDRLKNEKVDDPGKSENIFKLCCQPAALKPLVIVITFSFLQMFSGTFIVVFYAIDIISEFGADFDTRSAAIWTAVVRMFCTLIICVVLLLVRRRRILVVSGIGSGFSCLILSIFLFVRTGTTQKGDLDVIVAAVCLLSYIAFNTALMVMPGIMVGELFPSKIRGRTAGAVFAAMNIALFGLAKAFPLIQAAIKMRGVFMIFAISSFLVAVFVMLFQPETKGRSLNEIEDYFNQTNWFWFRRDRGYKEVVCNTKNNNNKINSNTRNRINFNGKSNDQSQSVDLLKV